jgi:hypothetical protein
MGDWVVRNGEWYLSEGPSWAVSTWTTNPRQASTFATRLAAREVATEAVREGHRPFGERPEGAKAVRKPAEV